MNRPQPDDHAPYYQQYVDLVNEDHFEEALENSLLETQELLSELSDDLANMSYAPGKWSIKDTLIHLIDTERIFCSRALAFARNDQTALPGFDHEHYVKAANANMRSLEVLHNELEMVRGGTIALFQSFTPGQLTKKGTANGLDQTVLSLAYVIPGHERHHVNVIRDKYIPALTGANPHL